MITDMGRRKIQGTYQIVHRYVPILAVATIEATSHALDLINRLYNSRTVQSEIPSYSQSIWYA